MSNDDHRSPTPSRPRYLCEMFGFSTADQARLQTWLNARAAEGYRLADRQTLGSGGVPMRMHVVMELQRPSEAAASAQGGA